jgi:hypothetical protein
MVICILNNILSSELDIAVLALQDVPISLAKRKLHNPVLGWSVDTLVDLVEIDRSVWCKGRCYFASTTAFDGSILIARDVGGSSLRCRGSGLSARHTFGIVGQ